MMLKSYTMLIPHFIYCFILWLIYTKLPTLEVTLLQRSTYLTLIGVLKYLPILLFSTYVSHKLTTVFSKNTLITLFAICAILINGAYLVSDYSIQGLITLFFVTMMSLFYEPAFDAIKAQVAKRNDDYITVNALSHLMRTLTRFIAPLIITLPAIYYFTDSHLPLVSSVLIVFFAILYGTLTECHQAQLLKDDNNFFDSVKELFSLNIAKKLLIIYSMFYLSINYLEYFVLLLPKESARNVGYFYSILGLGFMVSNIVVILFKKKITNPSRLLTYSLAATGVALFMLPNVTLYTQYFLIFTMGLGNGMSVPLASTLMQKSMSIKHLTILSGMIDTFTNLFALLSLAIGWLIIKYFSVNTLYMIDGLIILSGSFIWWQSSRSIKNV